MKTFFSFLLIAIGLLPASAFAYFVAVPGEQRALDPNRPVRILVSGRGADLGDQPLKSALGRAQLYKRNFIDDQLVLISVFENTLPTEANLARGGWVFIEKNGLKFETDVAMRELLKFNAIRSLEFFGHNSPSLGTQSDGLGFRFDFRKPIVATLASRFTADAYSLIHGCNSGWILAQQLSKVWGIAVAGSFTGTRFERLHSDGHYYVDSDGKFPDKNWAKKNADLDGITCADGGCLRMRASFSHYNGKWGDFQGPLLSHYKFFCQKDVKECEKAMAISLFGFLSERNLNRNSNISDFRAVAKEWLCPVYKDRSKVEDCLQKLTQIDNGNGNPNISYTVGDEQLSCTLRSCTGVMTCDDHTCKINGRVSKKSTTLVQEYLHLINGFQTLEREGL